MTIMKNTKVQSLARRLFCSVMQHYQQSKLGVTDRNARWQTTQNTLLMVLREFPHIFKD